MSTLRAAIVHAANLLPPSAKRRLKWLLSIPDAGASLENMKRNGFTPRVILDIGAYVGQWTRMAKDIFPDALVCMFEPQPDKAEVLARVASRLPGVRHVPALLGAEAKASVPFYLDESGSSLYRSMSSGRGRAVTLPMTTLDRAIAGSEFERPDLIKIDVQGNEFEIMAGGPAAMASAQVLVLELSLVHEYEDAPIFHEMIAHLAGRGFLLYDIATILRNNRSRSVNEMDAIFVREGHPLFDPRHYLRRPHDGMS